MVFTPVHSHAEIQIEFSCKAVGIVLVVFAAEIPHGAHAVGGFGGLHTQMQQCASGELKGSPPDVTAPTFAQGIRQVIFSCLSN